MFFGVVISEPIIFVIFASTKPILSLSIFGPGKVEWEHEWLFSKIILLFVWIAQIYIFRGNF